MIEDEKKQGHSLKFWKKLFFTIFILILLITTSTYVITNFEKETKINTTIYNSISETITVPNNVSLDIKWKNATNTSE